MPPAPGDDPEQDLRLAEGGVVGRDADVGAERELAAAAEGVAVDRRDDRLGDPRDRGERRLQAAGALDHVGVGHVGHLLDVRPGREDALAAPHHHGLDVVALGRLVRGRPDLLLHLDVEGVHLGAVEAHRGDSVGHLEPDELGRRVGHGGSFVTALRGPVAGRAIQSGTMPGVTPGMWEHQGETTEVWPGRNWPLGATWSPESTNFAVYAPLARTAWLCLYDDRDAERRIELTEHSLGIWHCAVPDLRPGHPLRLPRRRRLGPRPRPALQPRQAAARPLRHRDRRRPDRPPGDLRLRRRAPRAAQRPRLRAVHRPQRRRGPRLRLGGRHPAAPALARHGDLRAARQGHDRPARPGPRAPARHLRRAGDARGRRLPARPGRDGRRAAARAPVLQRAGAGRARAGQLLGLQLARLLRPAQRLLLLRRPRPAGGRVQGDGQGVPPGRASR